MPLDRKQIHGENGENAQNEQERNFPNLWHSNQENAGRSSAAVTMANSPIRSKQSLNCTPLVTRSATAKSNLYKDLDYLEESVDAEFQQYVADTLASTSQDPQLNKSARSDTSVRHDSDILRALEHVPMVSKARPPVGSSCRESSISNRNVVRSSSSRSGSDEEEIDDDDDEQLLPERVVSPGQYFGARSLPLESFNELWADRHQV